MENREIKYRGFTILLFQDGEDISWEISRNDGSIIDSGFEDTEDAAEESAKEELDNFLDN